MSKGLILLGCGVLVAIFMVGAGVFLTDLNHKLALLAIVALGISGLYWADLRRKARGEKRAVAYAKERFEKLTEAARAHGFELRVDAASQIVLTGILLVLGSLCLGAGILSENVPFAIGGGIAAAAGAFLALRSVPAVGKPKLVLGRDGFSTPLTPLLPWSVVHGMDMETVRERDDDIIFQKLTFYIPSLPEHLPRFGLFHRLLYPLRGSVTRQHLEVMLRNPSEPAEAVYDLAMLLWQQATGLRNDPNPIAMFERLHPDNAAAGADPQFAALRRDTEEAFADDEPEKARSLAAIDELEAANRRLRRYEDAVREAWREKRKRALWGVFGCPPVAGLLAYFAVYWVVPAFFGAMWLISLYVAFFEKEESIPPSGHAAGILAMLQRDQAAEERIIQSYRATQARINAAAGRLQKKS